MIESEFVEEEEIAPEPARKWWTFPSELIMEISRIFWIPSIYTVVINERKYVTYRLSILQRLFLTMNDSSSSNLAEVYGTVMTTTILLNVSSVVTASLPQYKYSPSSCPNPQCSNNPNLCPNKEICQPIPFPVFQQIDLVCVIIYVIDFSIRLMLCGIMPTRISGAVTDGWDEVEASRAARSNSKPMDEPYYSIPKQIFWFIFSFHSAIDIATIVPTFIQYGLHLTNTNTSLAVSYLRLSRLLRLFRLFRLNRTTRWTSGLLVRTLMKSKEAIAILVFYGLVLIVLFASIIQIVEGGVFTVNDEYPNGAFLRKNDFGQTDVSPFISIPVSIYYTIITLTTVGYGDLVPVTVAGRAIASVCALFGVLVLALPISIIGSNFTVEYATYLKRLQEHRALHKARRRAFRHLWMNGRKLVNTGTMANQSFSLPPREKTYGREILPRTSRRDIDLSAPRPSEESDESSIGFFRSLSRGSIGRFEQIYSDFESEERGSGFMKCWRNLIGIRRPVDIGIYTQIYVDSISESKSPSLSNDLIYPIDISGLSREELEAHAAALSNKYDRLQERHKAVCDGIAAIESTLSALNK